MTSPAPDLLPKAVSVKIRIDGVAVAIIKTRRVGARTAQIPTDELPLTLNSFVELEFFDGADRLIVPACVSEISDTDLTFEYEQTGETFEHWLVCQNRRP